MNQDQGQQNQFSNLQNQQSQQQQGIQQSRSKLIKYGDKIYLSSTEIPQMFLSARSLLEEKVYLIQELDPSVQISAYDNTVSENTFCIYPKLNYDAEKRYNKTIYDEMEGEEREILKRRAENEKLHNEQIIQRYMGKPVKIGQDVLLFHPLSNSFVKCSLDKQDIDTEDVQVTKSLDKQQQSKQEYFDLKLSTVLDGSIIFKIKIDPYYTFKKDGESICYEDQFYFQCQKLKTEIVYKKAPRINLLKHKMKFTEVISSAKRDSKFKKAQQGNSEYPLGMHPIDKQNYPPIFENQKAFQVFQAGHAKDAKHIDTFKAIHISDAESQQDKQEQKNICWGDYVRIKHILRENTSQGFVSCQTNICGLSPKIYLQIRNKFDKTEKECLSGIFQIIPPCENQLGKPIQFKHINEQTKQFILLRHVLTGKYLSWQDSISGSQEINLNPSINEYIKSDSELKEAMLKMQIIIESKGTKPIKQNIESGQEDKYKRALLSDELLQHIDRGHIPVHNSGSISKQGSAQKIQEDMHQEEDGLISNFMGSKVKPDNANRKTNRKQTALDFRDKKIKQKFNQYFDKQIIQINSSSSEEDYLSINSCFSIQNTHNRSMVVSDEKQDPLILYINNNVQRQQQMQDYTGYIDENRYIKTWIQTNPLEQNYYGISESKENADFFFFQPVSQEDITDLYSIYSKIYPIQLLAENQDNLKSMNMQIMEGALQSFVKLTLWICNSQEISLQSIQTQPIKQRQAMMRELGVIDMVVKIMDSIYHIHQYIEPEMKIENQYMYKLCINMIEFLKFANFNNIYNSIYTFQWYPLFKEMITSKQVQLPSDMQIDELLKELFIQTDFSTSYEGNIKEIAQGLDFSRHNNQALNLLIGFCLYSPTRSIDSYENMIKTLFEEKEYRLFRNFSYDGELKILIEESDSVAIDKHLQKNNYELFRYIMSILVLSSEICKGGNGSLIQNYIQNIYPYDICCKAFQNGELHPQVRALFLDLFASSYLSFDSRYFSDNLSFENNIQFQYALGPDPNIQRIVLEKKNTFFKKYQSDNNLNKDKDNNFTAQLINANKPMNLKGFLLGFLKDLAQPQHKIGKYDNYLIQSVLKVVNYMMSKGILFNKNEMEIEVIKSRMMEFLNKQYLVLAGYNMEEIQDLKSEQSCIMSPANHSINSDQDQYPNSDTIRYNNNNPNASFSNKPITPRNKTFKRALSLKGSGKEKGKKHTNFNQSTELAKAEPWMIEILEGLILIEKQNQYKYIDQFFSDKKNSSQFEEFYDSKQNQKANSSLKGKTNFSQKASAQIANMKKKLKIDIAEKIQNYSKNKIDSPVDEDIFQYQNYLDILTLGDNKLAQQIVRLTSLAFSRKKNFLKNFNDLSFIYENNLVDYNNFLNIQNNLLILQIDLQNIQVNKDQKNSSEKSLGDKELKQLKEKEEKELYQQIHDNLLDLMRLMFFDAEDPDTNIQNELQHAESEEQHLVPPSKEFYVNMNIVNQQNSKRGSNQDINSPRLLDTDQNINFMNNNQDGGENVKLVNEEGYITPTNATNKVNLISSSKNFQQMHSNNEQDILQQQQGGKPSSNELKSDKRLSENLTPRIDMTKIDPNKKGILKNVNVSSQINPKQGQNNGKKQQYFQKECSTYTLLGQYQFDVTQSFKIQDMLRNMNFHEQVIELLKYICGKIGAKRDDLKGEKQLIIEKCLIFLIFFIMKNVKNQNILAEIPNFDRFIGDILSIKLRNLQTYILVFISEIYRDNYHLLINLHKSVQKETRIFTKLKLKLGEELSSRDKENYQYSIYFMQLMVCFFKIKSATLLQNQQWIFREIFQSENFDFNKHFVKTFQIACQQTKQTSTFVKGNRIFVPDSILFLCVTLNITRQLINNQHNNQQILGAVKAFFSLNRIEECLDVLDQWYILKLEVIQFFIEVYLESERLEENEVKQIRNIIQYILYNELKRYVEFYPKRDQKQAQLIFQNLTPNVFNQLTSYSNHEAIIFVQYEKAQQNYFIFGIIEALDTYIENFLKNQHFMDINDQDADILQKYDEVLKKLGDIWSINLENLSPSIEQQVAEIRSKMHKANNFSITSKDIKKSYKQNSPHHYSPSNSVYQTPAKNKFLAFQTPIKQQQQSGKSDRYLGREQNLQKFKEEIEYTRTSISQRIYCFQHSEAYLQGLQQFTPSEKQQQLDNLWDKIRSRSTEIIQESVVIKQHEQEFNSLVYILVELKKQDSQKFKDIIQNLINILTNEQNLPSIKVQTMKILRSLANYKSKESNMSEIIHKDLCDLGFTDFLCEVISKDSNPNSKLEYILCLCDFLDEGDFDIQKSLLDYMKKDQENQFLHSIFNFIQNNFNDFKEYEKGLKKDHHDTLYMDIRSVISRKIHCCNYAFLALKLACEGHYEDMQNFLREQIVNGRKSGKTIDMIQFGCQIFREYIKVINNYNTDLGEMILDYLIEVLQGPCEKNQLNLSDTKILEDIEDLIYQFSAKSMQANALTKHDIDMSGFTKRIYILLLALAEGNKDQYLLQKIGNFLNPKLLLKRLVFLHQCVNKTKKAEIKKNISMLKLDKEEIQQQSMHMEEQQILHSENRDLEDLEQEEQLQFFIESSNDIQMSDQQLEEYVQQGINNLKSEGFNIYILLKSLGAASPQVKQKIKQAKRELIETSQHETNKSFRYFIHNANSNSNLNQKEKNNKQLLSNNNLQQDQQQYTNNQRKIMQYDKIMQSLKYYKHNVASIEIVNSQNEVQILYFQKLSLAKHLSFKSKSRFLETVNRDSANDKINGLLNKQQDFIEEMKHFQYWTRKIPVNFNKLYNFFRSLSLLMVYILNIFVIFDEFTEECDECEELLRNDRQCVCDEKIYNTRYKKVIDAMGFIVFIINIGSIILWAILQLSLDNKKFERKFQSYLQMQKTGYNKKKDDNYQQEESSNNQNSSNNQKKQQEELKLEFSLRYSTKDLRFKDKLIYMALKIHYFMFQSYFFYLLCYQFVALGGLQVSRLFFCILLLDIIDYSIILRNVIKSITVNFVQLGMTGILGVVIIFIYAMIAYYSQYVRSTMEMLEYEVPVCDTPLMCFMYVVNVGLRSGGGVGEPLIQPDPYKSDDYYSRFFFDLTFFLVIIIIWMNIIFGIIIDTFAALRDEKTSIDQDAKNRCFICSIERTVFEKEGLSFDNHTHKHHAVWNYLYYIVYLREKEQIDYNGTESYVAEKIKNDDISWFPIGKSLSLDDIDDSDDEKIQKILQNLESQMQYLVKQQQNSGILNKQE